MKRRTHLIALIVTDPQVSSAVVLSGVSASDFGADEKAALTESVNDEPQSTFDGDDATSVRLP